MAVEQPAGGLAHHSHAGPSHGEIASGARICRGNNCGLDHPRRQLLRIPLSTTHVIITSIMGVGAVKTFRWNEMIVVERIIWAGSSPCRPALNRLRARTRRRGYV